MGEKILELVHLQKQFGDHTVLRDIHLSVEKGEVRLVATTFEYAEAIDVERAKAAEERARERLAAAQDEKDIALARVKLARALNRQKVAAQ